MNKLMLKMVRPAVVLAFGALCLMPMGDENIDIKYFMAAAEAAASQTAVVTGSDINLRSGPGTNHDVLGQVTTGDRLSILGQQGDWYQVKNSNGQTAWIAGWLVKAGSQDTTTSTTTETAVVTGTSVNLRSGPGTSYPVQGQVKQGDKLPVLGQQGDWLKVKNSDGREAWLASWLVSIETKKQASSSQITAQSPTVPNQTSSSGSDEASRGDNIERDMVAWLPLPTEVDTNESNDNGDTAKQDTASEDEPNEVEYSDSVQGKLIFVDAGHGGSDPGAPGYSRNTWEEDANLDMALKLAAILKQQGAQVEMSRTGDQTVALSERPNMANRADADIFVSIHSNANENNSVRGTSAYFYAPNSSPDLYGQRADRQRLAQCIQTEMVQHANLEDKNIREDNFAVLRESKMPSVLVETAYISNPEEEKLLQDSNFRQQVAEAIARGINAYFSGK